MDLSHIRDLPSFEAWLKEQDLGGYWQRERSEPEFKPHIWRWEAIHAGLMKVSELVPMDQAFRRNIGLRNPSLGGRLTNTINMGVQCIEPGDVAPAHCHTAAAIRFIVKGAPGAYTMVEGEPIPMETGDLLTTPHWTWHDHANEGSEMAYWLDGLDVRVAGLGYGFREDHPAGRQPATRTQGLTNALLGHVQADGVAGDYLTPPFRYPWSETEAALTALKEAEAAGDPCDGYHLVYRHPVTGGPTLPTFACEIQLITPRMRLKAHRHNSTTIYHAFRGAGVTTIDGERYEWGQGDILVIPPWLWHQHEASDAEAILFSMTDWPSMTALGLYRSEVQD